MTTSKDDVKKTQSTTTNCLFRCRVPEVISLRISRADIIASTFLGRHSTFIIEILEASGQRASVSKRYKNFVDLHIALSGLTHQDSECLPELPPKRMFGNLDPNFIEDRRVALELYLNRLLRHPVASTSDALWLFLDVDDATLIVLRYLGPLKDEDSASEHLENLRCLLKNEKNLCRVSQDLIVERLVKCASLSSPVLLLRACLTLHQIEVQSPRTRASLVRFNSISTFLTLMERCPSDVALSLASQEFIHSLISHYPTGLVVFFRTQHGLSQIHRIARNTDFSKLHSFLGLLIWWSVDLPELQLALAEPESLGMDVLGSLYRSPNSTACLICGLIVSLLILRGRLTNNEMISQAAKSVGALPLELTNRSCRRNRFKLFVNPKGSTTIDINNEDPQFLPSTYSRPLLTETNSNSATKTFNRNFKCVENDATIVRSFDFDTFESSVMRAAASNLLHGDFHGITESRSAPTLTYGSSVPVPAMLTPPSKPSDHLSTVKHHHHHNNDNNNNNIPRLVDSLAAIHAQINQDAREAQPLDLDELDYITLYVASCSTPTTSLRLVQLIELCVLFDGPKDADADIWCVCSFLLWTMSLLVGRTKHLHPRGLLLADDFHELNQIMSLTETFESVTPWNANAAPSLNYSPVQPYIVKLNSDESDECWTPIRSLRRVVLSRMNTTGNFNGWSPSAATEQKSQEVELKSDDTMNAGGSPPLSERWDAKIKSKETDAEDGDVASLTYSSLLPLHTHLGTASTSQNMYLMRFLSHLDVRRPPWQCFSEISECIPTLESLLVTASSVRVKTYTAAVLLQLPWAAESEISDCPGGPVSVVTVDSNHLKRFDKKATEVQLKIIPSLKEILTLPKDQAALGQLLQKGPSRISQLQNAGQFLAQQQQQQILSTNHKSVVPSLEFAVPQRLLQQRMATIMSLLKCCEMSLDSSKESLKNEEKSLQKDEQVADSRQTILPLQKSLLEDFSLFYQKFQLTEKLLNKTVGIAKEFLVSSRTRIEAHGLTRSGLAVAAGAIETELGKLTASTEHLLDVHTDVNRLSLVVKESRLTADCLLRSLVDLNSELRRKQEDVRTSRRDAHLKRDRWIDAEQFIAEAPTRRKRLTEQLAIKEQQEASANKKLLNIQKTLNEAQIFHSEALTKEQVLETSLHAIERVVLDLENYGIHMKNGVEEDVSHQSGGQSDCLRGTSVQLETNSSVSSHTIDRSQNSDPHNCFSAEKMLNESHNDKLLEIVSVLPASVKKKFDIPKVLKNCDMTALVNLREALRAEISEVRRQLSAPGSSERLPRLHQLIERLKRLEAEKKKRSGEVQKVREEFDNQNNLKTLIDKSSQLQSEVRAFDAEAQRLSAEVEQLEAKVKKTESDLENKKSEVRTLEGKFFQSKATLNKLINSSNDSRLKLCGKILELEKSVNYFLSEVVSTNEDSSYAPINRILLHFTLMKEAQIRWQFRVKIREMITVLTTVDGTLEQLDQNPN